MDKNDGDCVSAAGQSHPYLVVYCEIGDAVYDSSGGDVINVSAGTYTETIDFDGKTVTVNGAGEGSTIVDADGTADQVMEMFNGSVVTVTGMTIQNGYASGANGGGVYNQYSTVTLVDVTLFDNYAGSGGGGVSGFGGLTTLRNTTVLSNTSPGPGGGIHSANDGVVVIDGSKILSNTARSSGGGIRNGGPMTVTDSIIASNVVTNMSQSGGGIYCSGSTITLVRATVSNNRVLGAYGEGGGIFTWAGQVNVLDGRITDNHVQDGAGGGIMATDAATLTIRGSTIASNTVPSSDAGGGIYFSGNSAAIENSAVYSNSAGQAGGIYLGGSGTMAISNTTVSDNDATSYGGGIQNRAVMTLTNCTIAGNVADSDSDTTGSGGGYFGYGSGNKGFFANTIIADNVDNNPVPYHDCRNVNSATNTSLGHNVVENVGDCAFSTEGDVTGQDPKLGALQDNGGPTWTQALLDGSVALDNGDDAYCPRTDQRGKTRVPPCDVGAYEHVLEVFLPLVLRSY